MSVATETELVNLALGHIGAAFIADYATEQSKEAAAARRAYPALRDAILSEFRWPFLYERKALTLSVTAAPPNWTYRYVFPTTYRVWAVVPGSYPNLLINSETGQWARIPYEFAYNSAVPERNIFTHLASAYVDHSYRLTDVSKFPDHFAHALGWALAAELVMDLAKDRKTRGETLQIADRAMRTAKANALNEGRVDDPVLRTPTAVNARRSFR